MSVAYCIHTSALLDFSFYIFLITQQFRKSVVTSIWSAKTTSFDLRYSKSNVFGKNVPQIYTTLMCLSPISFVVFNPAQILDLDFRVSHQREHCYHKPPQKVGSILPNVTLLSALSMFIVSQENRLCLRPFGYKNFALKLQHPERIMTRLC